jgi:hypothetical protein
MFDSVLPSGIEPISVVRSRWLWAARCFALICTITLVVGFVTEAAADQNELVALVFFGRWGSLSLALLYLLFRRGKNSLAFALGLGAATSLVALFGVASNALFWPLGRSFNLVIAMLIFGPVTPPFVDMMHQPNPQLATAGLLLFWLFGICSALLGLSSVVTFTKMAHEAKGTRRLRFAFRAGICCPLVPWLIGMLFAVTLLPFRI